MTVSDAERDYYRSILATLQAGVDKLSLQDLSYAYFLAALNGDLPGAALPPGGALGDVLFKLSAADGDVGWQAPSGGGGSSYELRGVGFPEGVVTANPGTYYTDTAATNGAIRWVKATGSGSTGWRVVYGDTGWRDVSGSLGSAFAAVYDPSGFAVVRMRRAGSMVTIQLSIRCTSLPSSVYAVLTIAAGFTAPAKGVWGTSVDATTGSPSVVGRFGFDTSGGGYLRYSGTNAFTDYVGCMLVYTTDDAWPAALPGTPA